MTYLNHFPGSMYENRDTWLSEEPTYGLQESWEFIHSVSAGCTASVQVEGMRYALEDGQFLGLVRELYDTDELSLQEIVEELHSLLTQKEK